MNQKILIIFVLTMIFVGSRTMAAESATFWYYAQTPDKEMVEMPKIYVVEKTLYVEKIPDGTRIEVFSIVGTKVISTLLYSGTVDVSSLSKGIYIVKVGKYTQKIIVK